MSETNQPIRPLPSPRMQEIAKSLLPQIRDRERNVTIRLSLSEGGTELSVTVSKHRLFFFDQQLRVSIDKHFPCCQRCRASIGRIRGPETQAGLANILQEVISTIQSCNCMDTSSPAASEQGQQSLRIQTTGNRVKVISPGESAPPQSAAQETIRLTKSRGVTVMDESRGAGTTEEGSVEKYTAPSVRFQPSSNTLAEVTIPRYVCEALIRHCRESNRHKREVGGVLVGYQGETQDEESRLKTYTNVITDLIHFKPSDSSGAHLCLDGDSWVHVSNIYEEKYVPWKKVRLGWYHTHPTQGIFFSPLDHDFHTNFNQPFQFAIVVDPRSMEAGLIYWKNYESRITEAPIIFSLKRRNDAGNSGRGTTTSGLPEGESPPLAWGRLFFFVSVTLALILYVVMHSPPFSVSPNHACLLALNVLFGLRLRNANFFRPRERVEDGVLAVLQEWSWRALDRLALIYEHHTGLAFICMLIAIVMLAVLLMFKAIWPQQRAEMSPRNQVGMQAGLIGERPTSSPQQGDGRLHLHLVHSEQKLSLYPSEGTPRVIFRKGRGGAWEPINSEAEKTFLRQVLKLNASLDKASDDVRRLQQYLYEREAAGGNKKLDGIWGAQIRNALLDELMKVQRTSREWQLPWFEEQPYFVVVKGNS